MFTKTKRQGHHYFLIRSALQKSIRRCEVVDTMYICAELDLSGLGNGTFQNLLLMASEDIGLADPAVIGEVHDRYVSWRGHVKQAGLTSSQSWQSDLARQELMKASYTMACAYKSRVVDYTHHRLEMMGQT